MARSRLEKIGTILSRIDGLLISKAMKPEEKPIWYEVYKAFPPKLEPYYDRPAPNIPIKNIFYNEDVIRARFQKDYKVLGTINISNQKTRTITQRFISIYNDLKTEDTISEVDNYKKAIELLNNELSNSAQRIHQNSESISISASFKQALPDKKEIIHNVDIKEIFKDDSTTNK